MYIQCTCTYNVDHLTLGEFKGHGNAFHGHGGHGNRVAQLSMCVRALLSICRTRDELVLQDLHEQGAIPLLVGQFTYNIIMP